MWIEVENDIALEELTAAKDADQLCRLLLRSAWGWGSSTRHREAVDLLRRTRGRGTLPGSFVALLLCTCHRWDRVTAKLIAAIEDSGMLTGAELDELAESLLSDEVIVEFPLAWVSERWVEIDPADGTTRDVTFAGETMTHDQRRLEPPLRRWAAAPALRGDPPGLPTCSRERTACRHATVTRCCTACSTPPTGWTRVTAASWCTARCGAA